MMKINLALSVATVDFLRTIDGMEVVLDSTIQNDIGYLLIYPKEKVFIGAIDDIFDNCEYDVGGGVDVEFGFDKNNPFKYEIGFFVNDSSFVLNNDLMFDLINKALIHNSLIDEDNQEDIILTKDMFYSLHNVGAIITINEDDLVEIENVEIFDVDGEFLDWINKNYSLVINKMDSNKNTWQTLLDDLKSKHAIVNPRSAYELAQVKFEYDETYKALRKHHDKITIPKSDLHRLEQLVNGGIVMLNEIINVDFANGGNIGVFMESMEKEIPIDFEMVNITDNMIGLDFK